MTYGKWSHILLQIIPEVAPITSGVISWMKISSIEVHEFLSNLVSKMIIGKRLLDSME